MKQFYLSADIEGTCGIAHWDETEKGKDGYEHFARQMSREVAAACEGILAAGAEGVLVKDAHDSARNINPELLPEAATIFRGWGRDMFVMMSGLTEAHAGVFFTGYHSAAGADGNPLSHTMNTQNNEVRINGIRTSELYINSLTAAMLGVPVVMVTGDQMLCDFIKTQNPNIYTVPVSTGVGNGSVSIHPNLAVRRIRETAAAAAADCLANPDKFIFPLPDHFTVEINFKQHYLARRAACYKDAVQVDSRTVRFETDAFLEALRFIFFVI